MTALTLNANLARLFAAHGVNSAPDGDRVVFEGGRRWAAARVVNRTQHGPQFFSVQLDIDLRLAPGRCLLESFGGFGATEEQAVDDAWRNFAGNSLHVLLATFFDLNSDQVERETWIIGGLPRQVVLGPIGTRGRFPSDAPVAMHWFDHLAEGIRANRLAPGWHWVRMYYAHFDQGQNLCGVLLDNDPWPELEARMAAFDWPAGSYYTVRIFLTISGGLDLGTVVEVFCRSKASTEQEIRAELMSQSADPSEAELAFVMLPLAFGRVLLAPLRVQVSQTAVLGSWDSPGKTEIILSSEPSFTAALTYAQKAWSQSLMSPDEFFAVALRSVEPALVDNALQQKLPPEELVVAPLHLFVSGRTYADCLARYSS